MASDYNNIDLAYTLPDKSLTQAQMLGAIQNRQQLEEQKQYRLYQQSVRNEASNLRTLDSELDWSKYETGEQAIDKYGQSEMQKIYDDALANHVNDDPAMLRGWLQDKMNPLTKWIGLTKTAYKEVDKKLQDLNKTYPNINYNDARDIVLDRLQKDIFDVDENGVATRKNTDSIKFSDYNSLMNDPTFLGTVTNDTTPFENFFYKIPKVAVGGSEYKDKKGFVNSFSWSGMMPEGIGEVVNDDDNKPSSIQLRGDALPINDEFGKPRKTLPQDIIDRLPPAARAAGERMWLNERPRVARNFMAKTGRELTPDLEEKLKGSFLYDRANQLISHDVIQKEKQVEPKPAKVTVNVGNKEIGFNDIAAQVDEALKNTTLAPVTALPSEAREYFVKSVNSGRTGDATLNPDKLTVVKGDDGTYRVLNMKKKGEVVGVFSKTGVRLKNNTLKEQKKQILSLQNNNDEDDFDQYKRK